MGTMAGAAQKKAAKCLIIKKRRSGRVVSIAYNKDACRAACKCHCHFALAAKWEKGRFDALKKRRKREKAEEHFKMGNQAAGVPKPRVWHADRLMGRMVLHFVALGYEDCLRFEIGQMADGLGKGSGDAKHDKKENLALEASLEKWLSGTSFSNVLRWFDAYGTTAVSTAVASRGWNSETTNRGRLFLEKLGM